MPKLPVEVPPEVTRLITHLRSTGTGESKLSKLTELAKVAKNGEEFLASAKAMVPAGTWTKIEEYLATNPDTADKITTGPEKKGRVESKSEMQSSIPEKTVTVENKSVTLKEHEGAQSRQLGGDVTVKPEDDPLNEGSDSESEEDSGEEDSPVKNMTADEAKDAISRIRSKDKLEHIVLNDSRVTVQQAAQKRLDELK